MITNGKHVAGPVATHSAEPGTPVTVPVKSCCEVLLGEACDCAAFAAEARGLFASNRVIMCRPARQWGAA